MYKRQVVYQSLKDQRVWTRPYDMFISKVDREKYPNAYQPYRLIKVKDVYKRQDHQSRIVEVKD